MDASAPRKLDAFCDACQEVRSCRLVDPGSCACLVCGHVILLMKPLKGPDSLPEPPPPQAKAQKAPLTQR